MKRQRDLEGLESLDLSNCLMFFSCPQQTQRKSFVPIEFECKTCNRKFSSFQALGGHRASHKRSKLDHHHHHISTLSLGKKQPKIHECTICGQKFSLGQALGGHMRRHKAHVVINQHFSSIQKVVDDAKLPLLFNTSSINGARVVCLDLNLTPLENDLKLLFGKMAPNIDVLV